MPSWYLFSLGRDYVNFFDLEKTTKCFSDTGNWGNNINKAESLLDASIGWQLWIFNKERPKEQGEGEVGQVHLHLLQTGQGEHQVQGGWHQVPWGKGAQGQEECQGWEELGGGQDGGGAWAGGERHCPNQPGDVLAKSPGTQEEEDACPRQFMTFYLEILIIFKWNILHLQGIWHLLVRMQREHILQIFKSKTKCDILSNISSLLECFNKWVQWLSMFFERSKTPMLHFDDISSFSYDPRSSYELRSVWIIVV